MDASGSTRRSSARAYERFIVLLFGRRAEIYDFRTQQRTIRIKSNLQKISRHLSQACQKCNDSLNHVVKLIRCTNVLLRFVWKRGGFFQEVGVFMLSSSSVMFIKTCYTLLWTLEVKTCSKNLNEIRTRQMTSHSLWSWILLLLMRTSFTDDRLDAFWKFSSRPSPPR